jgi:hypothetical protein
MILRSIAWLMGIVAIAAVDLSAIRAISQPGAPGGLLLCMAVLPMANILAVGLLIGYGYRGCRRFLSGFEAFGVAPLIFLIAAIVSDDWANRWAGMEHGPPCGRPLLPRTLGDATAVGVRADRRLPLSSAPNHHHRMAGGDPS